MVHELVDEVLRGRASKAAVLGRHEHMERTQRARDPAVLLQTPELLANGCFTAAEGRDRVLGSEMVAALGRQILDVVLRSHPMRF